MGNLKNLLEENGFKVYIHEGTFRIEKHTYRGVKMTFNLEKLTKKCLENYLDYFDIDEQIDLHRQNKMYKDKFSIGDLLEDFKDYKDLLSEIWDSC